ncbi:hypothetical protein C8E05_1575 [Rhodococcus wratislaviensis]|uniref:Excalibur calcium-binding domain-containing protein n=1 Tax=Rhodococcus wratislaviensis TaxID=44752 RepID=A0AB38FH68_RHOWR|nr:hypothetical protein [Rhodococcus wratislaviensis]REE72187.1 hypothetical protein C8E05_1575 [Rhodococcus wratislaviensis]SPZ40797.1 Uncharacterised protein [Rhodococcus wratislaviensis]
MFTNKILSTAVVFVFLLVVFGAGFSVSSATASAQPVSAAMTCEDAPEYMPAGVCGPVAVELDEAHAERVSFCTDGLPVFIDPTTGDLFGDQDRDGVLAGDDCAWS